MHSAPRSTPSTKSGKTRSSSSRERSARDVQVNVNVESPSSHTMDFKSDFCPSDRVMARTHRYPLCVVWTPIPFITWILPVVGHMGIATSEGVVRDFAGSYFVAEDDMGFGWPTRYWKLDIDRVVGGVNAYDKGVSDASNEYEKHSHNLCCDNCHSHVALALNRMAYNGSRNHNMISVWWNICLHGRYVCFFGWLKQWLPFLIFVGILFMCMCATGFLTQ